MPKHADSTKIADPTHAHTQRTATTRTEKTVLCGGHNTATKHVVICPSMTERSVEAQRASGDLLGRVADKNITHPVPPDAWISVSDPIPKQGFHLLKKKKTPKKLLTSR